jgi:hypothetical protein
VRSHEPQCACDGAFMSVLCLGDGGNRTCRPSIRNESLRGCSEYVGAQTYTILVGCYAGTQGLIEKWLIGKVDQPGSSGRRARHAKPGMRQSVRPLVISTDDARGAAQKRCRPRSRVHPEEQAVGALRAQPTPAACSSRTAAHYRGTPRRTRLTTASRMTAPRNETSKLGTLKLL